MASRLCIARWTTRSRLPGILAATFLLASVAACGNGSGSATAPSSSAATSATGQQTPSASATSGNAGGNTSAGKADVSCSGRSCSVILTGDGASADILGTTVALTTVQDGRATVHVGNRDFSCRQGESVSAGPLSLSCSTVKADSVTLTASVG